MVRDRDDAGQLDEGRDAGQMCAGDSGPKLAFRARNATHRRTRGDETASERFGVGIASAVNDPVSFD